MQNLDFLYQNQEAAPQPERYTGRQWTVPQAPRPVDPIFGDVQPEQSIVPPETEEEGLGFLGTIRDFQLAPIRGVESFVRNLYGAADFLSLDLLPDWNRNVLTGSSETAVGGFVESAVSFGIGFFVPFSFLGKGTGFLSKANQASKATKLGKFGIETARATTAGAISDFTLYDRQEARLAQIKEQFPDAAGPLDAYMADQLDENQLTGRLKQAAIGATFGVMFDGLIYGARALKAARKAMAKGADADAVIKAAQQANVGVPVPGAAPLPLPTADDRMRARGMIDGFINRDLPGEIQLNPREPRPPEGTPVSEAAQRGGVVDGRQTNLAPYQTTEEGQRIFRGLELEYLDKYDSDPHISSMSAREMEMEANKRMRELLVDIGATESETGRITAMLVSKVSDASQLVKQARATADAGRTFVKSELERLHPQLVALKKTGDRQKYTQLEEEVGRLQELVLSIRGYSAETGRSLRAQAFKVNNFRGLKDSDFQKMVDVLIDATDPTKPMAVKPLSAIDKFWGVTNEVLINNILSGMRTFVTTGMSATSLTIYNPLERMFGGVVRAAFEKDIGPLTEAFRYNRDFFRDPRRVASLKQDVGTVQGIIDEFKTVAMSVMEAGKYAGKAVAKGPIFTPQTTVNEFGRKAVSSAYLGLNKDSMVGRFVDMAGKGIRTPTAVMGGIDEFFKQINGRGIAKAELYRKARTLGIPDADIDKYVYDRMEMLIVNGQLANEESMLKALKKEIADRNFTTAEEEFEFTRKWWNENFDKGTQTLLERITDATDAVNMTAALREGTLSNKIQNIATKHPYLRVILPFVRTSANLMNWTIRDRGLGAAYALPDWYRKARFDPERVAALSESHNLTVRDIASGDSIRQSEAFGRVAAASAFLVTAVTLTASGTVSERLTGKGPTNPAMRKAWLQAGYQPFSIKINGEWVSYARMDPFATSIGFIADLVEIGKWAPEDEQSMVEEAMVTVLASLTNNFTNKSYFQGLADFLGVMEDPDKNGGDWISRIAGNLAVPNFFAQITQTNDPVMRDVDGVLDRIKSRIPGLGSFDPQRNVLGEPISRNEWLGPDYISPIAYTEVKDDVIFEEMLLLRRALSPPQSTRSGMDLKEFKSKSGQSAYDRWLELSGTTSLNGMGLRDRLRKTILDPRYQQLSPDEIDGYKSPRVGVLQTVLKKYQQHAWYTMLKEYPELDQKLRDQRQLRKESYRTQPQTAGAPAPQASGGPSQSPLFSLTR